MYEGLLVPSKRSSKCCYERMNWEPGKSIQDYKEDEPFCNEPDLSTGAKGHSIKDFSTTPKQPIVMGWSHQQRSNIQGWRASPSSSSNLSTYNSSKNILSMPSSSSNHLTHPEEFTKASRQNTQFETLPIEDHGLERPLRSPSTIDSVLYLVGSNQHPGSLTQKSVMRMEKAPGEGIIS